MFRLPYVHTWLKPGTREDGPERVLWEAGGRLGSRIITWPTAWRVGIRFTTSVASAVPAISIPSPSHVFVQKQDAWIVLLPVAGQHPDLENRAAARAVQLLSVLLNHRPQTCMDNKRDIYNICISIRSLHYAVRNRQLGCATIVCGLHSPSTLINHSRVPPLLYCLRRLVPSPSCRRGGAANRAHSIFVIVIRIKPTNARARPTTPCTPTTLACEALIKMCNFTSMPRFTFDSSTRSCC
jgi:hypothetical protein